MIAMTTSSSIRVKPDDVSSRGARSCFQPACLPNTAGQESTTVESQIPGSSLKANHVPWAPTVCKCL